MSLPVKIKCPYLEQCDDVSRLGQMQAENKNFFREINALLTSAKETASLGTVANDTLTFAANPTAGDEIEIGDDTWKFATARSKAFEIAIGSTTDDTITNAVAAINDDTTENVVAEAALATDQIHLFAADEPGGKPVAGPSDIVLGGTFTNTSTGWAFEALSNGTDHLKYEAHISIEGDTDNIASDFLINTGFKPTELRFRVVTATGLPVPSCTAVASISGNHVLVDLDAGATPLTTGQFFQLDVYGSELL